ncbi:MAG: AraC family transcriptional regulator [Oscillospiraceae bacterium]|jgi:hypothetical protein|nr:AraC family transcriptional regulator [Oscillospiraceae bacterium]
MTVTLRELKESLGLTLLTESADMSRAVEAGYCCDLLSWVLARGVSGMAWITVQTHMNAVAVATLLDMSCLILPEDIQPEPDTLARAAEEGVAVFVSRDNAYALCGKMRAMGVPAAAKA